MRKLKLPKGTPSYLRVCDFSNYRGHEWPVYPELKCKELPQDVKKIVKEARAYDETEEDLL